MGIDVKEEPDAARNFIGLISHQPMLYPDLTAEENLLLYAKLYGVADPQKRVNELLDVVGLSHRRLEPYSGLDPHAVDIFDSLIADIRDDHTFVMVSHDLQKGFAMCSHALVLARGRVVSFDDKNALDFSEFSQLYRETVGMGVA